MSPDVARKLLVLVNNKPSMDALFEYAEESIRSHVKNLVREPDHNNVLKIQGSVQELQRFATFRDEVIQKSKEGKNGTSTI